MKPRRRHLLDALAVAVVAIVGLAPSVQGQDDGPVVIGERDEPPRFYMEPIDVALELRAFYSAQRVRGDGGTDRFRQYRFDELLHLSTRGHIVHPNLVDYHLNLGLGLSQTHARANRRTDRENEALYEFDTAATFLREQTVPLTLYAQRRRSIVSRPFGPSLENVSTTYGARTSIYLDKSNHTLDLSRSRSTLDGFTGQTDFQLDQDRFLWSSIYRPSASQRVDFDYQFTRTDQRRPGFQTDFDTHDLRLSHSLNFGRDDRHNLTSSVRYREQTGDLSLRTFRWDEYLRLRHTDRFETRYRYSYTDRTFGGVNTTQHRGSAGFRHRLFDSLVTTGNIGFQDSRTNDSRSEEIFGDLNLDYRKRVPYGMFTGMLGLAHSRVDSQTRPTPLPVINDPHTFANALPVVLFGPEVDAGSIIVKDPAGLIVYTPGIDYVVTPFADRVEIHRVVGGRLDAGDAVLLDYVLAPRPRHQRYTDTFTISGRYDIQEGPLRGLGFYSRYARQDQRIETAAPGLFVPADYTDVMIGADYRTGDLTLRLERQWRDSRILPFEATRFNARYQHRLSLQTNLVLSGGYSIIDYTDPANRVELFNASAQVQHDFNSRLRGVATLAWRDERNELFGRTTGFEQQLELQWRYRQTEMFISARNADLRRGDSRSDFQLLYVGLRREF